MGKTYDVYSLLREYFEAQEKLEDASDELNKSRFNIKYGQQVDGENDMSEQKNTMRNRKKDLYECPIELLESCKSDVEYTLEEIKHDMNKDEQILKDLEKVIPTTVAEQDAKSKMKEEHEAHLSQLKSDQKTFMDRLNLLNEILDNRPEEPSEEKKEDSSMEQEPSDDPFEQGPKTFRP